MINDVYLNAFLNLVKFTGQTWIIQYSRLVVHFIFFINIFQYKKNNTGGRALGENYCGKRYVYANPSTQYL